MQRLTRIPVKKSFSRGLFKIIFLNSTAETEVDKNKTKKGTHLTLWNTLTLESEGVNMTE
jgi:hypothetical protein